MLNHESVKPGVSQHHPMLPTYAMLTRLFFIFGFSVLFPTIVYKTFMFPILARPVAATCTACSWSARLTLAQYGRSRFGNVHIVAR
jgi:hypothetical protein